MKRLLLFVTLTLLSASCEVEGVDETPLTLYATLEAPSEAESQTKVYADSQLQILWNADDRISVFYKDDSNFQFRFDGNDGDNNGPFVQVGSNSAGNALSNIYAIYPYSSKMTVNAAGEISLTLPTVQYYRKNSFGAGANTMVSVTEEGSQLQFKNVGGYLSVKLYGAGVSVKSVTLRGNNHEKLAGDATVTMLVGDTPMVVMQDAATEFVKLSCSTPVALEADEDKFVEFWFVLPPTEFSQGFTVTVTDASGGVFKKSTQKAVSITRNSISRMAPVEVVPTMSQEITPEEVAEIVNEGTNLLDSDNEEELGVAFERFTDAADAGSGDAKMYLAYCYEYGIGTEQDMEKAKQLYGEAAAEGVDEALVKQDQLVAGNTNAEINIPGATPKDLEGVVLLCDGTLKTPNGDGSFAADENQIVATTSDQELIYFSFRNPGRDKSKDNLILDATETALSMLMWGIPFAFEEMTDEEFAGMRAVLLSYTETQNLIVAIRNSVAELGYLDVDRITSELDAAVKVVGQICGISTQDSTGPAKYSFAPINLSKKNVNYNLKTKSGNAADAPSFRVGSPVYYSGTKVILDSVEPIIGTSKWKCKILFYNYEPIYLALMKGRSVGGECSPDGDWFLDHVVRPQNSNYIWNMSGVNGIGALVEGQKSYWSDTIDWINGNKAFEDGYWNATETDFEMEVNSEDDLFLVYSTSNCPQLFAYSIFQLVAVPILKMIVSFNDNIGETLFLNAFLRYGTDAEFIYRVESLLSHGNFVDFIELIKEVVWDVFFDCLDVASESAFMKAVQPRYKTIVRKWKNYSMERHADMTQTRAQFKADMAELKAIRMFLKVEAMAINLGAWWLRQSSFDPYYLDFSFPEEPVVIPTGPYFSVADNKMVAFAPGNLQATTTDLGAHWTWRFATNQYDYIGNTSANSTIDGPMSVSENGTVDLFGWQGKSSTVAANYGIINSTELPPYGTSNSDVLKSDWGVVANAASLGGHTNWRTLTPSEWWYLMYIRRSAYDKQGLGTVAGVHGLILLPDIFVDPCKNFGSEAFAGRGTSWSSNVYNVSDWNAMESGGAVFLPAAGSRVGTTVVQVGDQGRYWTTSEYGDYWPSSVEKSAQDAWLFSIAGYSVTNDNRWVGCSVRLIRDYE